jgi:hypothetical protein
LLSEPEAAMAFREVRVFEVREVLRLWLAGEGIRATERLVGFDRKTVRRYVEAAVRLGLVRDGGDEQLSDVFIGLVVEAVGPHRTDGRGETWALLVAHHDQIAEWVKDDVNGVKIAELLARRGVESRRARFSAMSPRFWAADAAGGRRSRSRMATRAMNCRSTSVAWASSSTR